MTLGRAAVALGRAAVVLFDTAVVFERAAVLLFAAVVALGRAVGVLVVEVLPADILVVAGVGVEAGARLGEADLPADLPGAVDWAARSRT